MNSRESHEEDRLNAAVRKQTEWERDAPITGRRDVYHHGLGDISARLWRLASRMTVVGATGPTAPYVVGWGRIAEASHIPEFAAALGVGLAGARPSNLTPLQ